MILCDQTKYHLRLFFLIRLNVSVSRSAPFLRTGPHQKFIILLWSFLAENSLWAGWGHRIRRRAAWFVSRADFCPTRSRVWDGWDGYVSFLRLSSRHEISDTWPCGSGILSQLNHHLNHLASALFGMRVSDHTLWFLKGLPHIIDELNKNVANGPSYIDPEKNISNLISRKLIIAPVLLLRGIKSFKISIAPKLPRKHKTTKYYKNSEEWEPILQTPPASLS